MHATCSMMKCREGVVVVEDVTEEWESLADSYCTGLCTCVIQVVVPIGSDMKTYSS